MKIMESIFGMDITGDGKADLLDDMLVMDLIEEDEKSAEDDQGEKDLD